MNMLSNATRVLWRTFGASIDTYFELVTSDDAGADDTPGPAPDQTTYVSDDGSLVSHIRIDGLFRLVGEPEYAEMVRTATKKLGALVDKPGHHIEIFFECDPDRGAREVASQTRGRRKAAEAKGLALDDLFDENERVLAPYISHEFTGLAFWTSTEILSNANAARANRARRAKPNLGTEDAQDPWAGTDELRATHRGRLTAVMEVLRDLRIKFELLEVHDTARYIRSVLYPGLETRNFQVCLPGDPVPPHTPPQGPKDIAAVLWPPLSDQILAYGAVPKSPSTVEIGSLIWAHADMTLGPKHPTTFPKLHAMLRETRTPFRMSFKLKTGVGNAMPFKRFLTAILGFTNRFTRIIAATLEHLINRGHREPMVQYQASFATWAPRDNPALLDTRLSDLLAAIEGWGDCLASPVAGDPVEGVFSSAFGINRRSTGTAGIYPLADVLTMLPLQRPTSPHQNGSVMLRTEDGRLFPHKLAADIANTFLDLIIGTPGKGKSALANTLNFGKVLASTTSTLPYIAIVDVGGTSLGALETIIDALPVHRRHEVQAIKLQMTAEFATNVFDTPLGLRSPLPDQREFLNYILLDICTPAGEKPPTGISQLITLLIPELYRRRSDKESGAQPRRYYPAIDHQVDDALGRHEINLPAENPLWWEVVDALFLAGDHHAAAIAQRYAVPTLDEVGHAAQSDLILDLMGKKTVNQSTEPLTAALGSAIAAALTTYPNLAGTTKFDLGPETRICAIDVQSVAPTGGDEAKRQSGIMYLVARFIGVRHWWLDELAVSYAPDIYKPYYEALIPLVKEVPKRFFMDEYHRTPLDSGIRKIVVRDPRENRKWGIEQAMASHLFDDFDEPLKAMASGIWFTGAENPEAELREVTKHVQLSRTSIEYFRDRLNGPKPGGASILLRYNTKDGPYEQFLISTMGPLELWAVTTTKEDVSIRRRVSAVLGPRLARATLAALYPTGSAKKIYQDREHARSMATDMTDSAKESIYDEMASEAIAAAQAAMEDKIRVNMGVGPRAR